MTNLGIDNLSKLHFPSTYQNLKSFKQIVFHEFAKSRPCMPAFQHYLHDNVLACQRGLRANVPKACQFLIFTCQRANKRANVSYGVSIF